MRTAVPTTTAIRPGCRWERLIAARASHIIATCTDDAAELTRMGVPRRRISVVPRGVDLTLFSPRGPVARREGVRHRVVAAGSLVPRKGFDMTIRALAALPDTELVIAGGGAADAAEMRRLRRVAAEAGVTERLRLPGRFPRRAVAPLLRSAEVVLCTPRYAPGGAVSLEAMACGRPVVTTAGGGPADAVIDGVTGRVVPSADPKSIAAAVRPLLDDGLLRDVWGAAGAERARTRYSWDRIAALTATVYRQVGAPAPEPEHTATEPGPGRTAPSAAARGNLVPRGC
ncbi:glycosyltransferase [Nocardia sp. alder85J]|uniref:glycosyltransferase n=1 Tax=Nocardia sp. alder85J TaxID=2862949 RepID=UPI00210415F9